MNDTHLPVLDHTVQQTNHWLKRLETELHFTSRQAAYSALRAVLHALRDRLTPEQAVHFGAQLPILIRGIYYEGWKLAGKPSADRKIDDFLSHVAAELPPNFQRDPLAVTRGVFELIWKEIDPGETTKIVTGLPAPLKTLWPVPVQH